MIDAGVDRSQLDELRREANKMPQVIFRYKAQLISRSEFSESGEVATVNVPQVDINQYSPLYNPKVLIQGELLQTLGVRVAIIFKSYDDGRVTAAIRCNPGAGIAAQLAEKFGGGGHAYAAGFKVLDKPFNEIKSACLQAANELLATLDAGKSDETV